MINIDDLTYGQLKQISKMFNEENTASPIISSTISEIKYNIGEFCIIRCRDAGVHAGVLVSYEGKEVVLKDSRRLWYWKAKTGHTLSACAIHGVATDSKIAGLIEKEIILTDACEILPCSHDSKESILNAKEHNT